MIAFDKQVIKGIFVIKYFKKARPAIEQPSYLDRKEQRSRSVLRTALEGAEEDAAAAERSDDPLRREGAKELKPLKGGQGHAKQRYYIKGQKDRSAIINFHRTRQHAQHKPGAAVLVQHITR